MGTNALQGALPDYEITQELGRGAMGIVYLGRHKALDRLVAIKELPPSFSADSTVRERFLTEARVVASLDHPHVVVIHDFVDRDGHLALVMEHLPNGTVWDQFLHHGLAAPRACGLVLATLAGVHHAHAKGIMHRDIKPENLIFTHDWQLKVTDFGIAQVLTGNETMGTVEGAIVGTPAYMSPEQAEGRTCGPQADVYASGAMLYEMLTGSLPFPNATDAMSMATARLTDDPVPIDRVGPAVPGAIAEAAMHALVRNERDRFSTAEEFGVALAEAAADTWGPDWMSESGTAVHGSEAIEVASRTTRGSSTRNRAQDPASRQAADSPDAAAASDAEVDEMRSTTLDTPAPDAGDAEVDEMRSTTLDTPTPDHGEAGAPPAAAPAPLPAPAPIHAPVPVPTAQVVPRQRERVAGANLHELVPADMFNLAEVRSPRSPAVPALLALVGIGIAVLVAFTGFGSDPTATARGVTIEGQSVATSDEIVEVDLTKPFAIDGTGADTIKATFLGIPIGSAAIEDGQVDPGYLRYSGAGVIELTPDGSQDSFPVRSSNSVFPTAPFVAAAMIAVGGLASVQSNLRGMRSRRIRISPYVGLVISGALAGGGSAVLAMLLQETPTSVISIIGTAAAAAFGSLALGEAYRRWRRRRRLKRVTVATGRRP